MNRQQKIMLIIFGSVTIYLGSVTRVRAQSIADNIQMLVLDYQKLAGLKKALQNMYSGYQLVSKGYNSVKDVSQGNFNLHEAFLDGLMMVSPQVRNYPKVALIIANQAALVKEYKNAWSSFHRDPNFKADELDYMATVYTNLTDQSLQNLDALSMVMADNRLRMDDQQRMQLIDQLYGDSQEQLSFLRQFNNQARALVLQRTDRQVSGQAIKQLYGIH